jgi:hypothetical protein
MSPSVFNVISAHERFLARVFPARHVKKMAKAMDSALSTLPHPVGSARIRSIAETILRSSKEGERDPAVLARMALLELSISPRE